MSDEKGQRKWAIEGLVGGLDELVTVLGQDVAPTLAAIKAEIIAAMAERDRGDTPAAVERIGRAMKELAALGDRLDPAEGAMMRALAASFAQNLGRGDSASAEDTLDRIQDKAGKPRNNQV